MGIAYLAITILLAAMVTFSGIGKIRSDPRIVQIIHEVSSVSAKMEEPQPSRVPFQL
jgi:hypothetical protein